MNLTRLAVVFVVISLPFYFISDISIRRIQNRQMLRRQYETIINNAVDDGTLALRLYATSSYDDDARKDIEIDAQEVLKAFLSSYHYGFNAKSSDQQTMVDQYILALVIVAYDGYYVYGTKEVQDLVSGGMRYQKVLSDKRPFVYEEGNDVVWLTLDDHVRIVRMETDPVTGELWPIVEGDAGEPDVAAALPGGMNVGNYDSLKDYVITSTIESALADTVRDHNQYTKTLGMNYEFHLPVSDVGGKGRHLEDLSLLVFFQGKDLGGGHYLELNAVNQGSVLVGQRIEGYEEISPSGGDSLFYYCDRGCSHGHINAKDGATLNEMVKVFATKEEAASDGYWPCSYVGR